MTVEELLALFRSLEPGSVLQEIGALLHGLDVRVFVYQDADPMYVSRFGHDNARRFRPPRGSVEPPFDIPVEAIREATDWCRVLPLMIGDVPVGLLELTAATAPSDERLTRVRDVASVAGQAVRNAQLYDRTKRLTFTDDLTALYNSRFMSLYLDREIKRCRRTRSSLTLLFMDLDGFKAVNDTHGHLAGSRTLVEVGAALERTVRDADVLIRYGGDEFVILFPETPLSGGLIIAERIRKVIGGTRFLESMDLDARVSASIGIASFPESADDVRTLIACADEAMYKAKALGKNRVVVAPAPGPPQT